jgi:hypothetical protein
MWLPGIRNWRDLSVRTLWQANLPVGGLHGESMNRRGFFKALTGTVALAAVLPEIWTPTKTIFLPPRGGWLQRDFQMREVQQYLINSDALTMRYDMAWIMADGTREHWHVDFPPADLQSHYLSSDDPVRVLAAISEHDREFARQFFRKKIPFDAQIVPLQLPRGVIMGRYV